jgi:single-strand selective monofunctional uracil DNA glycosylase
MLKTITDALVSDLAGLTFGPPVTHVYNPLIYAREAWDLYCEKYGQGPKEVLMLGMNPGPFGMAQTGVPFGEIAAVRDWMGIESPVEKPEVEHPKRPILGFACLRSEVSGRRVWAWAAERFGAPEAFFARAFVANWCPLVFMEEGGRNRTPDKLPRADREPLEAACDRALRRTIELLAPRAVLGFGKLAEERLRAVAGDMDLIIGRVAHPSPANPAANRGWAALMDAALAELGLSI